MTKNSSSSRRDLLVLQHAYHASAGLGRRVRSEQLHVLAPTTTETSEQYADRLRRRLKRVQNEGGATSLTLTLSPQSQTGWLCSRMMSELRRSVAEGGELVVLGFGVPPAQLMSVVGAFLARAGERDVLARPVVVRGELLPSLSAPALLHEPEDARPLLTPLVRAHESGPRSSRGHHRVSEQTVPLAG